MHTPISSSTVAVVAALAALLACSSSTGTGSGGAGNDAPVAVGESYTATQGTPLTVAAPGVLSNDSDADGDALVAIEVGDPTHGTLTLAGDGSFSYSPTAGYAGADSFTYRANDGSLSSAVVTVSLDVQAPATQGAPVLLDTDVVSGSPSGGENGLGAYMSLFGYGFGYAASGAGAQAALGTAGGAQVWLRNPAGDNTWRQVANYRALIPSRVYPKLGVEQIIVQLGSLGGQATAGARLDVKVTVDGVDSNVLPRWFTVQPGRFFFVSLTGSDSTGKPDDITRPFRYVQNFGSDYTGIWATTTAQGDAGWRPGDTIVIRGGTWTDEAGFDDRWVRFRHPQHLGSVPNGTVGHGYFTFVRYPGPVLGHAPEAVRFVAPPGGAGGIHGPNSAYFDTTGHYVVISGLAGVPSSTGTSDGGFIDLQSGGDHWRVFDNDIGPWAGTLNFKAGGIAGQGTGDVVMFNRIHDIGGSQDAMENHGIYIGSGGQGDCAHDWEVAYNWIHDVTGGSGLQFNDTNGGPPFTGHRIHHNWLEHLAKSGINLGTSLLTADLWDNVVLDACTGPQNGGSFKISDDLEPYGGVPRRINIVHNTVIQYDTTGGYPAMLVADTGTLTGGAINITHNIFALGAGHHSSLEFDAFGDAGPAVHLSQNLWFDFTGRVTAKPGVDALGTYANPQFSGAPTSATSAANYALADASPARDACTTAEPVAVATDLLGRPRPVTGTSAPGASRNDLGAFEYVAP